MINYFLKGFILLLKLFYLLKRILTISIYIVITLIPVFVQVCVFLVVVFDHRAVITGVPEVILINVSLVHVGHQLTVILYTVGFILCK